MPSTMDEKRRLRRAQLAAATSLASTHSVSVLAEALQSSVDILMSLLTLWTLRIAAQPADERHPWGHGKAELLSSALQMVLVVFVAATIVWQAALRLLHPMLIDVDWGLAAMGYSVVANVAVMLFVTRVARGTHSAALEGEAQHLGSDA